LLRSKKKVNFTFDTLPSERVLSYIRERGEVRDDGMEAVLELKPDEIAPTVEQLVAMKSVPVNVETQNLLQQKYLEITA
jgi:hypothetical protein